MEKSKMITLGGMFLVIISVFLPFVINVSMYTAQSDVAIFFIIIAAISGVFGGVIAKKWSAVIGFLFAALLLLLAFKYQGDASGLAGYGLHLFTLGSLALTVGNVMAFLKKKK